MLASFVFTFRTLDSLSWGNANIDAKIIKYSLNIPYNEEIFQLEPFPILPCDWGLVDARLVNTKLCQLCFALKPKQR